MTDPPPNFTVGTINLFFKASFGFLHTRGRFFWFSNSYLLSSLHTTFFQNDKGWLRNFLANCKRFFWFTWLIWGLRLALQLLNPASRNRRRTVFDDTVKSKSSTNFLDVFIGSRRHSRTILRSSSGVVRRGLPLFRTFSTVPNCKYFFTTFPTALFETLYFSATLR